MHGSEVFLYCNNAFATWSLSVPLWCDTLSLIILLADFTPNSALPFDCGYSTGDSLCVPPHFVRKLAHCFQLDIWKKIFRIFRIFKKTPNTKKYLAFLLHQTLCFGNLISRKKVNGSKTLKKSIVVKL